MNSTLAITSTGASAWAGNGMPVTVSPKTQHEGGTVPFAGYAVQAAAQAAQVTKARTALRTTDGKVPDPRGRQR